MYLILVDVSGKWLIFRWLCLRCLFRRRIGIIWFISRWCVLLLIILVVCWRLTTTIVSIIFIWIWVFWLSWLRIRWCCWMVVRNIWLWRWLIVISNVIAIILIFICFVCTIILLIIFFGFCLFMRSFIFLFLVITLWCRMIYCSINCEPKCSD